VCLANVSSIERPAVRLTLLAYVCLPLAINHSSGRCWTGGERDARLDNGGERWVGRRRSEANAMVSVESQPGSWAMGWSQTEKQRQRERERERREKPGSLGREARQAGRPGWARQGGMVVQRAAQVLVPTVGGRWRGGAPLQRPQGSTSLAARCCGSPLAAGHGGGRAAKLDRSKAQGLAKALG
jgi:hypothetical protein